MLLLLLCCCRSSASTAPKASQTEGKKSGNIIYECPGRLNGLGTFQLIIYTTLTAGLGSLTELAGWLAGAASQLSGVIASTEFSFLSVLDMSISDCWLFVCQLAFEVN